MPPRCRLVYVALDIGAYRALERLAKGRGQSVDDLAEELLTSIAEAPPEPEPEPETTPAPPPPAEEPAAPARPPAPKQHPKPAPGLTPGQAETARRLQASRFSTADIARLLKVAEASVEKALAKEGR